MTTYCPACLDVWTIQTCRILNRDFVSVRPGVRLHVTCGRALEAARTAPPTYRYPPVARAAWAS